MTTYPAALQRFTKAIFDEDSTSDVDFEITLTALLATVTLGTTPVTQYLSVLRFFAYLLLFVTLLRRIAISNSLKDSTNIFEGTRILILSLSYVLIFAQIFSISQMISNVLSSVPHLLVVTTFVILMFIFWVVIQEELFGDLAIYAAMLANNAAVTAQGTIFSPLSDYLIDSTGRFVYFSNADNIPDVLSRLQPKELEKPRNRKSMTIFLIVGIAIFYGLFWGFLAVTTGSVAKAFVFLISAIIIQYPVDFLYSRYGAVGFYNERSGLDLILPIALGVILTLLIL
ncbi:hypothetical protein EXE53_15640 [Halorubrum sp. SD626R]|nr:hypothetical protein EXE53_15640 [Halorubrum sp. SD626R]